MTEFDGLTVPQTTQSPTLQNYLLYSGGKQKRQTAHIRKINANASPHFSASFRSDDGGQVWTFKTKTKKKEIIRVYMLLSKGTLSHITPKAFIHFTVFLLQ